MSYILFDDIEIRLALMPFTLTRPVAQIRLGIFTIAEKWEYYLKQSVFYGTQSYLEKKYPSLAAPDAIFINGAVCPTLELFEKIQALKEGQALVQGTTTLAFAGKTIKEKIEYASPLCIIRNCRDIFQKNGAAIREDFKRIQVEKTGHAISDKNTIVYNAGNIFLEPGVKIRAAVLNAEDGPIYLGRNAEVQEGALIKGPFVLGESAVVNMGGKMRGDTTIGPFCKVGGEISNSVLFGFSNKAHDGFIGNTVIGEWCNLGAGTNTSNLKNNYGDVSLFSYKTGKLENTGTQFCGLMMGDHSKTAINTMLNTGTVVGVCSNIFGSGFPPKFVPSFSWGGAGKFEIFNLEKALEIAGKVMARRSVELSDTDKAILQHISEEALKAVGKI